MHSVIQANQQSVIQTATQGTMITKGNVILLSKPNSVIQTTQGNLQTLQVVVYFYFFIKNIDFYQNVIKYDFYFQFFNSYMGHLVCIFYHLPVYFVLNTFFIYFSRLLKLVAMKVYQQMKIVLKEYAMML